MHEIWEAVRRAWPYVSLAAFCGLVWLAWSLHWLPLLVGNGLELHFVGGIAFTCLTAIVPMWADKNFTVPTKRFYVTVGSFAFLILTIEEVLQVFQPWRTLEVWDWTFQNLGIVAALLFVHYVEKRRQTIMSVSNHVQALNAT